MSMNQNATFDFDRVVDRHNTNSMKWDFAAQMGQEPDALPLWVADMDFPVAPYITQALHKAVDHGIFGYSDALPPYVDAVRGWFATRHEWETEAEWLVKTPGVVFALAMAVRALTEPGDAIIVTPPVYYPFFSVVRENGRRLVESPLVYDGGRYDIDFDDFEHKVAEEHVRMFILCSPHNPVGRVWTIEELARMGEICARHDVLVVSDEIHCDFVLPGHEHTVFVKACPEMLERTVVCTAPSKSFNLAGLQCSNIWIPGEQLRKAFEAEVSRAGEGLINTLGLVACQAAYEGGGEWLDACWSYMQGNLTYLREYVAEHIPGVRLVEPDGTYFAWLDCSGLGLSDERLSQLIKHDAKLWLDEGSVFSPAAGQFERVVLACPRSTLAEALTRLEHAVKAL